MRDRQIFLPSLFSLANSSVTLLITCAHPDSEFTICTYLSFLHFCHVFFNNTCFGFIYLNAMIPLSAFLCWKTYVTLRRTLVADLKHLDNQLLQYHHCCLQYHSLSRIPSRPRGTLDQSTVQLTEPMNTNISMRTLTIIQMHAV